MQIGTLVKIKNNFSSLNLNLVKDEILGIIEYSEEPSVLTRKGYTHLEEVEIVDLKEGYEFILNKSIELGYDIIISEPILYVGDKDKMDEDLFDAIRNVFVYLKEIKEFNHNKINYTYSII